ncbi:hypothetical protein DFR67_11117 [Williamsia limnetica]|jgi:hypothetical protein|uniref:Uncharacterized protein n=1 Tax=Williamsia limnetica TaxID=882452 RepID=A0A318RL07_WILLI|nr:hypothetical protein [Williamsia limnetica]PYE14943.1 hypothetical protein DFR67_11117 [Williamsia limnetica]
MSDWVHKIKEEAKGFVAKAEQEFTVLEGVDGVDPLDKRAGDVEAHEAETAPKPE